MDPTGLPATVVYAYQWIGVDGRTETNIAGTTSSTYTLTSADQGKKVKARVVFLDSGGNDESLTSEPTATVVAANPTPATGTIAITGSVWVGQTLTATPTNVTDPNGLPDPVYYTYQWIRVDGSTEADIAGATSSTYTLTSADLGKKVKARVTFRDNVSNDETLTSEPTVPVPGGSEPTPGHCTGPRRAPRREGPGSGVRPAPHGSRAQDPADPVQGAVRGDGRRNQDLVRAWRYGPAAHACRT